MQVLIHTEPDGLWYKKGQKHFVHPNPVTGFSGGGLCFQKDYGMFGIHVEHCKIIGVYDAKALDNND